MIGGLLWLLGCQVVGEAVVRAVDVPVPGPVVGLVLLLGVLHLRRRTATTLEADADGIERMADGLLAHLQLFFVPAGVGVVAYGSTLRHDAVPLLVAIVGSWVLALAAVGWVVEVAVRRRSGLTTEGR